MDCCCGTGTIPKEAIIIKKSKTDARSAIETVWACDKYQYPLQVANISMKKISNIQVAMENCQRLKPTHDKYIKINWKIPQKAFADTHQTELTEYNRDFRFLKKEGLDVNSDLTALQTEYKKLEADCKKLQTELATVQPELKSLKDIRYWVSQVMKPSIKDRLADSKEKIAKETPKTQQTKKHAVEI